jgi:HTH-type transcriptional regulator / antitoxin HigA
MQKIENEANYLKNMAKIEVYLQKATQNGGFSSLTLPEREDLRQLSLLAESWEDAEPMMPIRAPKNLIEMIELRMYERKMKQKDLATILEISNSGLSEIMQGKRKVSLDLAKRLWQKLEIDPRFILETA